MKTFKLFLKGILLYSTLIIVAFTIAAIDVLLDKSFYAPILISIACIIACFNFINKEDLKTILFTKYFYDGKE